MNKKYFTLNLTFFALFILLFLSSCSTSKSIKQINLIDKNITNIQSEVKEVKNTIRKTKETILKIKQEQDVCNLIEIDNKIEILDIQINNIDNNLINIKQQIKISRDIIKAEIREYKIKYHKCIIYIVALISLLFLILFNKIKVNIYKITEYIKNIYNWFKNRS